ncbi:MAG TPA: Uma2 family endonuclease, partial [Longimicrobium sp.]
APAPAARVTPEEYLAFERASPERHEYVDGDIRAMTGASWKHGLLKVAIASALHDQLRGRPCESFISLMRTRVPTGDYLYPDVVVAGGGSELEDEHCDTLLNPTLVVEVLSPSTEDYDYKRKWEMYRRIPSLQDYLLVAQDEPRIARYSRFGDEGLWLFGETTGLDAEVVLESLGCVIRLADVYERVL